MTVKSSALRDTVKPLVTMYIVCVVIQIQPKQYELAVYMVP